MGILESHTARVHREIVFWVAVLGFFLSQDLVRSENWSAPPPTRLPCKHHAYTRLEAARARISYGATYRACAFGGVSHKRGLVGVLGFFYFRSNYYDNYHSKWCCFREGSDLM